MLNLPEVLAVSELGLALISAGSAVAGSLVGGAITGFFTLKGEKKRQDFAQSVEQRRQEREDQATLAVVRGAAREWARLLSENRLSIDTATARGHWWPSASNVQMFTSHEDRKLIASMLSRDDFATLERAESGLYNMVMMREIAYEGLPDDALPPLDPGIADRLRSSTGLLRSAEPVLRDVGDPPAQANPRPMV